MNSNDQDKRATIPIYLICTHYVNTDAEVTNVNQLDWLVEYKPGYQCQSTRMARRIQTWLVYFWEHHSRKLHTLPSLSTCRRLSWQLVPI